MRKFLFVFLFALGLLIYFKRSSSLDVVVRTTIEKENPQVNEKVLICGVCRNIEKAVPNTIASIKHLGEQFSDYRTIVYENNSTDKTRKLLKAWSKDDPHVIFLSEQLSTRRISKQLAMKIPHRIDKIARARNIVLDVAMSDCFDDFKYVVWADLDFLEPWDVDAIVETISHPQEEWDAVFANGAYDLFALRSHELPIGYELIGSLYFEEIERVREKLKLDSESSWMPVYSAFGGLGIYKREAMRGCRYSGVVTQDLETVAKKWLQNAQDALFFEEYQMFIKSRPCIDLAEPLVGKRENYPEEIGVRLKGGELIWLSCSKNAMLPWTCEHVPFHASMALRGHNRFFINPKIGVNP